MALVGTSVVPITPHGSLLHRPLCRPASLGRVSRSWRRASGVVAQAKAREGGLSSTINNNVVMRSTTPETGLLEWLQQNGLPPVKVELQSRQQSPKDKPMAWVVASEDLKPGDIAFRIPDKLVVTLDRVLGNETIAELLTTNQISELACLALYLMYEKKRGKESEWYAFIKELDRQRGRGQLAVESPLLWKSDEVEEYLKGSPFQAIVKDRLEGIKKEYEELDTVWFMAGSLFKQYPYDTPTEAFSFDIFKQAFVAIQSSVVHLQGVSLARRFALVPLGPPLLSYKSNCRAMLKAKDGAVEMEVDREYKKGDRISVWCGPQPNARLLLNYGIIDEDNPYDRLTVQASLDMKDPLYQSKRVILQRNKHLSVQTFQIYRGKEQAGVSEMLPYLRLAHVTESEEMESVTFAQGPVCPVSPCNERASLQQLATHLEERLGAYGTSVEQDMATIVDADAPPRKRVAAKLLRLEKELLLSTLKEVQALLALLPPGGLPCSNPYGPKLQ